MLKSSLIKKANSRRTSPTKKIVYLLLGVFLCGGLLFMAPFFVRSIVTVAWYPFDMMRIWVAESGSSLPLYIRERSVLIDELEALKIKIATEQGTESTIKKLQVENTELRNLAGALPEPRVLARVIGRPNTLPYDLLMLDRGSTHGAADNIRLCHELRLTLLVKEGEDAINLGHDLGADAVAGKQEQLVRCHDA